MKTVGYEVTFKEAPSFVLSREEMRYMTADTNAVQNYILKSRMLGAVELGFNLALKSMGVGLCVSVIVYGYHKHKQKQRNRRK